MQSERLTVEIGGDEHDGQEMVCLPCIVEEPNDSDDESPCKKPRRPNPTQPTPNNRCPRICQHGVRCILYATHSTRGFDCDFSECQTCLDEDSEDDQLMRNHSDLQLAIAGV